MDLQRLFIDSRLFNLSQAVSQLCRAVSFDSLKEEVEAGAGRGRPNGPVAYWSSFFSAGGGEPR